MAARTRLRGRATKSGFDDRRAGHQARWCRVGVSAETKVPEISRFEIALLRCWRLLRVIVIHASSSTGVQAFQGLTAGSSCAMPLLAAPMVRMSKPAENQHVRAGAHMWAMGAITASFQWDSYLAFQLSVDGGGARWACEKVAAPALEPPEPPVVTFPHVHGAALVPRAIAADRAHLGSHGKHPTIKPHLGFEDRVIFGYP